MNEAAARAVRERGRRAEAILQDEVLAAALAAIERRLHREWASSPPGAGEAREQIYRDLRALGALRTELEGMIRDGRVAEHELESTATARRQRTRQEEA